MHHCMEFEPCICTASTKDIVLEHLFGRLPLLRSSSYEGCLALPPFYDLFQLRRSGFSNSLLLSRCGYILASSISLGLCFTVSVIKVFLL